MEKVETIEKGNIYFFYRPKIDVTEVNGIDDIQRSYIVLSIHGEDTYRLIVLGQKKLPKIKNGGEKYWGFVDKVGTKATDVEDELDPETYQTKTRGERTTQAARPMGEGVYRIVQHGDHTHLVYVLELPEDPGEVQKELNIVEEGSYIISVRNPDSSKPKGVGLSEDQEADFPKELQEIFEDRKFADVNPSKFLNYEGAEILLIGAKSDISEELGIELNAQKEDEAHAEIFNDLRVEKSKHPLKPLFGGKWA